MTVMAQCPSVGGYKCDSWVMLVGMVEFSMSGDATSSVKPSNVLLLWYKAL